MALWCNTLAFAAEKTNTHIIVNTDTDAREINEFDLMAIFSMQKQYWENGQIIQIVSLRTDHPLHQQFTLEHLGIQPYQLERGWNRNIFRGIGKKPIIVNTLEDLVNKVMDIPGAIGYISAKNTIDNSHIRTVR